MTMFIDHQDFNGQFERTLTAVAKGSADLGEAFAIAAQITPGDFDSWVNAWTTKAGDVLAEADASLAADDPISARKAYLRACEYYRQAFFFTRTNLDDPILHSAYTAHVNAFRAAMPLFPFSTTVVDVAVDGVLDGVVVQGYLFRPDDSGTPRPTIIAPAGYDSTAENGYVLNAAAALERDMNCLVIEGPGQGGVLYERRLPLRPDYESVLTPAVDWLLTQPGVDPASLVLFGRSFAGYLAPRGASAEPRLAALICDPAQYDFGAAIRSRLGDTVWERLQNGDPTLEPELTKAMMTSPAAINGFQWRMAAHGVTTLEGYLQELSHFNLIGQADQITCPTLALAGEGDFAGTGQLATFAAAVTGPVTTHEFTVAEGAGGHCEGIGQDRLEQYTFGWLTAVLARDLAGAVS
ncbi:MAG: dipeptidyl aminopeptidase/acylaminoacyl peptidase [Pseudonocardiales bacterium]|nr:dipeptidyl aminopeptidase/acylaminoacyl peptidase [Pseudonocardiales bacterium]